MVTCPAAGVEDMQAAARRHGPSVPQSLGDLPRNEVEVPGVEKRPAMTQLLSVIAPVRWASPASRQQVYVAFPCEIEAVPFRAGERAGPCVEAEPADRTAQQPKSRARQTRRHDAAPPG